MWKASFNASFVMTFNLLYIIIYGVAIITMEEYEAVIRYTM